MQRRTFVKNSVIAASAAAILSAVPRDTVLYAAPRMGAEHFEANGFTFARLRYNSGNWDADPKMPSNILNSLVEYTSAKVNPDEQIVDVSSDQLFNYPFVYLTGNKLLRFSEAEKLNLRRYLRNGGFMFVDDCNHDVDGTFARTFEPEMCSILDGPSEVLKKLPKNHSLYNSFFRFPDGPPS